MVNTRRRKADDDLPAEQPPAKTQLQRHPESEAESDDAAPEEVSLATGKQAAEQRRRGEIQAKVAARSAVKERRAAQLERQRAAKVEQQAAAVATATAQVGADADEDAAGDEGQEGEQDELDLLPDSVIAALASNKRAVPTAEQARLISEQLRRPQRQLGEPLITLGQAERGELIERDVGPVVVRVLQSEQPRKPSQSARDFLQQRLHAGVKRSADMLKPIRSLQPGSMTAQHWRQAILQGRRR